MPFAWSLSEALHAEGIEVLMLDDDTSELPWEVSLNLLLNRADHAVVIVSDKPSTWVMREIEAVQKRKIPITPVLIGPDPKLPGPLRDLQGIHASMVTDDKSIARDVAERIKNSL